MDILPVLYPLTYLHYIKLPFVRSLKSIFQQKNRTSIKPKFNKMLVVTRFKSIREQPHGIVASPRDREENHTWKVGESRQGKAVVARHEKVGSSTPTFATAKEIQSSPGVGIFKCKDKSSLTCAKYFTDHKFKCNIIKKNYNSKSFQRISENYILHAI